MKPLTSTRYFTSLRKVRDRLENAQHPDQNMPALWRGKDAGGRVSGDLEISSKGQLPNDDHARPSTVGGYVSSSRRAKTALTSISIITPIKVSHSLVTEVYFSVYGETDRSEKMSRPGPVGLRLLKISRPIILPSVSPHHMAECSLIRVCIASVFSSHRSSIFPPVRLTISLDCTR